MALVTVLQPQPGRAIFADHVYSAEDGALAIYTLLGQEVARLVVGDQIRQLMFRHVPSPQLGSPGRNYAWALCWSGARVYDVTDPYLPQQGPTKIIPATSKWRLMGGGVDHETGLAGIVEERRIDATASFERKYWTWSGHPFDPARGSQAPLGTSDSDRGGLVEPLGGRDGRRLMAATWSAQSTAIVDVTEYAHVVSRSLPCVQAMASRDGWLYGTDGDPILDAHGTGAAGDAARWNTWRDLGGVPEKVHELPCPGFVYNQCPNLRAIDRAGQRYLLSGWTDGGEQEMVSVLSVSTAGVLRHLAALVMPLGIVPALIDVPPPGAVAYVWGYRWLGRWAYYLVPIDIRDPRAPRVLEPRRLGA